MIQIYILEYYGGPNMIYFIQLIDLRLFTLWSVNNTSTKATAISKNCAWYQGDLECNKKILKLALKYILDHPCNLRSFCGIAIISLLLDILYYWTVEECDSKTVWYSLDGLDVARSPLEALNVTIPLGILHSKFLYPLVFI